jgi:hypothetical protein
MIKRADRQHDASEAKRPASKARAEPAVSVVIMTAGKNVID